MIFVIPTVSGEKDLKLMIYEQIPTYKTLATALNYTGPEKFHNFDMYCFGPFKVVCGNELAQLFCINVRRTNPAFDV